MRHRLSQQVVFRDIDYFQHANNAAYSTWSETARLDYMREVCGVEDLALMNIVLGTLRIRFVSPALYRERVEIRTQVSWLGHKSFAMEHELRGSDGRLVAEIDTVQVCFDHATGETVPLPAEWRRSMEEFEGRPLDRPHGGATV